MIYAHIFRFTGGRFQLILSNSAAITIDQVISTSVLNTYKLAAKAAKAANAKPWNY